MKTQVKFLFAMGILVAIYTMSAFAATPDGFEPDNLSAEAKPITTDGQVQSHSINPAADIDWLTFSLDASAQVIIQASGTVGDTKMWLYGDQLNELYYNDDSGGGSFSMIQATLPAGTYYLRIQEYNDKALIDEYFVSVTASPIEILSITPDLALTGETLTLTITGQNTTFFQGSSTIANIWLSKGGQIINADAFNPISPTTVEASFQIPADAATGKWDINVEDSIDGHLTLTDGFVVYTYPDLNGDGKVDNEDLALLSKHWLKTTVPNVAGMTDPNALTAITAASLAVGTITQQYNNTIASGLIISQSPVGGTIANAGSSVNLVISKGVYPKPDMTWVPINDSGAGMKDGNGNPISHGGEWHCRS